MNFIEHAFHKVNSRKWPYVYWAIDVHDVIFKGTYKKNNEGKVFYPWAKEVLQNLTLNYRMKLILFTASHEQPARDVISWLSENKIEIFALNENPDQLNTELCDFTRKFYFDILLEDKAGFEGWHDWFRIMKELQRLGEWIPAAKDDGLEVTVYDNNGNVADYGKGPTSFEQHQLHRDGQCDWNCPVCNFTADKILTYGHHQTASS
jgi:hypothetical protein